MLVRPYRAGGFTLLEVLLVIVILVALAALVLPNIAGRGEEANIGTTKIQMGTVKDALEFFKMKMGRYPTTDEGLESLFDKEAIDDEDLQEKWTLAFMTKKSGIKDAWGHQFHYVHPGENNEDGFDLYSDGPDGEEDTDDDIINWEKDED